MTQIVLELTDEAAQKLARAAENRKIPMNQLLNSVVNAAADHLDSPTASPDFDKIIDYVLSKNRELYRRLA